MYFDATGLFLQFPVSRVVEVWEREIYNLHHLHHETDHQAV